jgi:hypothetical protein
MTLDLVPPRLLPSRCVNFDSYFGSAIPHMLRLALCLSVAVSGIAAEPTAAPTAPVMRQIDPGIFQVGQIRIDQRQGTISFPARVNMSDGNLEYLLVTPMGPTHESLLSTEIRPADLHFSMLLLGAKGAGITTPAPEEAGPAQINKDYLSHAPRLKGDQIQISVKWKAGDAERSAPVEDWISNNETNKPAPRGPWIYTGSMFVGDRFLAQSEGALAALVTLPAALINNPRKGSDNDLLWAVNAKAVPPVDTPVELVIKLEPAPPAPSK